MTTYRTGNHWGVTIVAEGERCCDLHNEHCELPSELCCARCTEATHDRYPTHSDGVQCVMTGKSGQLVAVVVNGDQALAERICELLNGAAGPCPATVDAGMSLPYLRRCELLAGHAGDHKDGGMRWWDVDDDSELETG